MADKQAAAAVGQGLLIEEYTRSLLVQGMVSAQILLTQDDFADQRRYQNAQTALNVLLSRRVIPIINENDTIAIDELKVGDNDTLSAQVASLLKADLLVLLTDVPGLYSDNPRKNPDARPIPVINEITPQILQWPAAWPPRSKPLTWRPSPASLNWRRMVSATRPSAQLTRLLSGTRNWVKELINMITKKYPLKICFPSVGIFS